MSRDEKTITYSKDIIKNVSRKSGIPEDEVKYVFDFFFITLKRLMKRPDVHTIRLPKFCTLYASLPMLRLKQKELHLSLGNAVPALKQELLDTEHKIGLLEAQDRKYQKLRWKNIDMDQVHNSLPMISSKWYHKGYSKKELEEFQNAEDNER